jgi:hypothetical protein
MLWIPVVFVCLTSGQCDFIYESAELKESACIVEAKAMGKELDKFPQVDSWKATCIPVEGKKI